MFKHYCIHSNFDKNLFFDNLKSNVCDTLCVYYNFLKKIIESVLKFLCLNKMCSEQMWLYHLVQPLHNRIDKRFVLYACTIRKYVFQSKSVSLVNSSISVNQFNYDNYTIANKIIFWIDCWYILNFHSMQLDKITVNKSEVYKIYVLDCEIQ